MAKKKIKIDSKTIEDTGLDQFQNRNEFGNASVARYSTAANLSGGTIAKTTSIKLGTRFLRLNGDRGIVISDGTKDRLIIGKIPETTDENPYVGIKQSKEGFDVNAASPEEIMFQSNRIYIQHQFNTFTVTPNGVVSDPVGFVNFSDAIAGGQNRTIRLDFYKSSDITYTSVILYQQLFCGLTFAGATADMTGLTTYLNPDKTKTTGPVSGHEYYVFSNGDIIRNGYDQTADDEQISDTFDSTEIAAVNDGWNTIAVQSVDNDVNAFGFIVLNLVCTGYKTFT